MLYLDTGNHTWNTLALTKFAALVGQAVHLEQFLQVRTKVLKEMGDEGLDYYTVI